MNGNRVQPTGGGKEDIWKEYEHCARLEQDLVRNRWTFFTAMLSVSFVVAGLTLSQRTALGLWLGLAGFFFGWLSAGAAFYHYWWFHRISHAVRKHLCTLEEKLGIEPYRIRSFKTEKLIRPEFLGKTLKCRYAIYILAAAYTVLLIVIACMFWKSLN